MSAESEGNTASEPPAVSVVVSTRNRPSDIVPCIESILRNRAPAFELIVVDQSDDDASKTAVASQLADPRLRFIASTTRGLSNSRNVAVAAARAPVLAFTDDDCRVTPDWVGAVHARFAADPALALLFGGVVLRPEDRAIGYAAEFEPTIERELVGRLPDVHEPWGVGANMSVRRSVFERLGAFDPILGAGARFFAAEETDLTLRALGAGFKVVYTPDLPVTHLGVRSGADAGRLMRGYGIGLGAAITKHARLRTPGSAELLAAWLSLHARRSIGNALRGQKQPGFGLVAAVAWGSCRSLGHRVDHASMLYDPA